MRASIGGKDLEFDSFEPPGEGVIDRAPQESATKAETPVARENTNPEVTAMIHPRLLIPNDVAPADDHPFADGIELAVPFLDEVGDEPLCHFQRGSFGEEQVAAFPGDAIQGSPERLCSIDRCRHNLDFHVRAPGNGDQLIGWSPWFLGKSNSEQTRGGCQAAISFEAGIRNRDWQRMDGKSRHPKFEFFVQGFPVY